MAPLVSVIIPTYNRAAKVSCAVRSALNQSCRDIEVIVADDGSADDTLSVLRHINDSRLHVLEADRNRGVSFRRNDAVEHARGRWIAFLDDDDLWMPNKIERQLLYLEGVFKDCPAAITDYRILNEKQDYLFRPSQWRHPYDAVVINLGVAPTTLMVRRDAFNETGGFDTSLPNMEDAEWFLRYLKQHKVGFVPEVLAVYSGSHASERVHYGDALQYIWEVHKDSFGKDNRVLDGSFKSTMYWQMAKLELMTHHRYGKGLSNLSRAFINSPTRTLKLAGGYIKRNFLSPPKNNI